MGFKSKSETALFDFYRWTRKMSGSRKRVKEFKHKENVPPLTSEQKAAVKAFYAPYKVPNMAFHSYFTARSGEFHAEYIPQDVYVSYIDPYFNDIVAAKYYDNKALYGSIFAGIPQCENVLKRVNRIWMDGGNKPVTEAEMEEILANSGDLFVKEAQTTAGGSGVTFFAAGDCSLQKVYETIRPYKTDIVIQKRLIQHAGMSALNASSLNSIRMISILHRDGNVKIYAAMVRMGSGTSRLDNFSAGGMSVGIDENGRLCKLSINKAAERYEVHPTSHTRFEGYEVPSFEKAKALVRKAHPMVAHFRQIAWDVAINEAGEAVLIEANLCRGGVDSIQIVNGPLYGSDTKLILDEVFGKNKKTK